MRYEDWEPFYDEILVDFGFSRDEDEKAARVLDGIMTAEPDTGRLEGMIRDTTVGVYGAGPSLEECMDFPEEVVIAADGATSFIMERGRVPDIIVTDLDGNMDDIMKANRDGALIIIHAHGDNIQAVEEYAHLLLDPIGTTQAAPLGNIINLGGFTDGDRAVFLAEAFHPKEIVLYGMDFKGEIGIYSLSEDTETKRKKLKWAERLIQHLKEKNDVSIRYH